MLALEDLEKYTEKEVVELLIDCYSAPESEVKQYKILIAYQSVGDWGCDSSAWFLLRHKKTKELFEQTGSHCSCYGFEEQWGPTKSSLAYLKSDNFTMYCGGYDNNANNNKAAINEYIRKLKNVKAK